MKFMYSILVSCLLFIGQAQAIDFKLLDATSFDPQPVLVSAADNSVPIGTVIIWTKEIIPEGWLECNGQPVNEALYPDLHKLMPNTPNYQGMFLRGAGSQTVNHGGYGNTAHSSAGLGQIQGDSIRNITGHWYSNWENSSGPYWDNTSGSVRSWIQNNYNTEAMQPGGGGVHFYQLNSAYQVPTSTENRPVNVGVKYLIKAE